MSEDKTNGGKEDLIDFVMNCDNFTYWSTLIFISICLGLIVNTVYKYFL